MRAGGGRPARLFACLWVVGALLWPQAAAAADCTQPAPPPTVQNTAPSLAPAPTTYAHLADDSRRGPLFVRSRAPVWDNALSYQPATLATLPRGRSGLQLQLSHVNVWAQMAGYFYDGEWTRLQLRWRVGLGPRDELTLDAGLLARSGGLLDGAIESFHRAFGLTQSRRDRYARNRLRVERHRADGASSLVLSEADEGVGASKPAIGLRHTLWRGNSGERLLGELTLSLPLGATRRQFAARGAELLGGITAGAPLVGPLTLYGAFGATVVLWGHDIYGFGRSAVQKFFFLALHCALGPRVQLGLQYLNQDGAVESSHYAPLDKTTHEFALGVRALVGAHWSVEFAVIENTVHDANTPDVGVVLGVAVAQ